MFSAAAGSLAALLLSAAALAQPAPAAPPEPGSSGDDEDAPVRGRPLPRDDRSGHVTGFAGATVVVPAGELGAGLGLAQVAGPGIGGELGIGVGLSRHATLELVGQFVRFGSSRDCQLTGGSSTVSDPCRAQMFAGGLGLTYHTSQALGFDPWVRFGTGYRAIQVSGVLGNILSTAPGPGTFHGVDVANLTLGGDFFPVRWLGLGLFLQGNVGVLAAGPATPDPEEGAARGSVYGFFQAGLRIALEPQRKAVNAASSSPPRRTARAESSDFAEALYNRDGR